MITPQSAEAHIRLVSAYPVEEKLDYATIGGFTVTTANNERISFDWSDHAGNQFTTDDGHVGLAWELTRFDSDHFSANDNETATVPDWATITESRLSEVYYDNKRQNIDPESDESAVRMTITEFKIIEYNDDYSESVTHEFTKEQLAAYNALEIKPNI